MARPRVLITRSPHQASAVAEELRDLGAEPVLIPTIELVEPASFVPLDAALASLSAFDWLLFTSANAVDAFAKRGGVARVSAQKIGVIGAATAKALEVHGLHADIIPPRAVAESLAESLLAFARQADGSATRFLLVRAESAREVLPDTLRAAGAEVVIVPAYRTVVVASSVTAMRELFAKEENWPDAICFASGSSVTNLLALLEAAELKLPDGITLVSIGPVTSRTLHDAGLLPQAEAADANVHELALATMRAIELGKSL